MRVKAGEAKNPCPRASEACSLLDNRLQVSCNWQATSGKRRGRATEEICMG